MPVKNSGWGTSNFQDLLKKNEIQRRHSIILYCTIVRMPNLVIKDHYFVNFEMLKTTENAANTDRFTTKMTPVCSGRRFQDVKFFRLQLNFQEMHYNDSTV